MSSGRVSNRPSAEQGQGQPNAVAVALAQERVFFYYIYFTLVGGETLLFCGCFYILCSRPATPATPLPLDWLMLFSAPGVRHSSLAGWQGNLVCPACSPAAAGTVLV